MSMFGRKNAEPSANRVRREMHIFLKNSRKNKKICVTMNKTLTLYHRRMTLKIFLFNNIGLLS